MKKANVCGGIWKAVGAGLLVLALSVSGCSDGSGGGGGGSGASGVWLADVANPLIGQWKSEADSDGATLTFIGKTDGTFQYIMEGVPVEMGLPDRGTGGYLVMGNVIISCFDFGLVKSNMFQVLDNNTVTMTAFTLDETAQKIPGEATNFHRIGTAVLSEYRPMVLPNNIFIGKKWAASIPEPEIPGYSYESTWEFNRDGTVIVTFIGLGPDLGLDTEDAPFTFAWVIVNDTLILFTESQEGNEIMLFKFAKVNSSTINVSELEMANGMIAQNAGEPVVFTRSR
jgi:hypothetical protein